MQKGCIETVGVENGMLNCYDSSSDWHTEWVAWRDAWGYSLGESAKVEGGATTGRSERQWKWWQLEEWDGFWSL